MNYRRVRKSHALLCVNFIPRSPRQQAEALTGVALAGGAAETGVVMLIYLNSALT
jgi:hypothetical protein